MRKPTYNECTDEHGVLDVECYEEACGRYADSERDRILEEEWNKPRLTLEEMYNHLFDSACPNRDIASDMELRLSNIFAVKNTVSEWIKQFD